MILWMLCVEQDSTLHAIATECSRKGRCLHFPLCLVFFFLFPVSLLVVAVFFLISLLLSDNAALFFKL